MARTYAPTPALPVAATIAAQHASASSSSQRSPIPPLSPVDEDSLADSLHDLREPEHDDTDAEQEHPEQEHPRLQTPEAVFVALASQF